MALAHRPIFTFTVLDMAPNVSYIADMRRAIRPHASWQKGHIMSTTTRVTVNGQEFDIDAVRNLMDDDLCERIHGTVDTDQEFVDAYCKLHAETFGQEFEVN